MRQLSWKTVLTLSVLSAASNPGSVGSILAAPPERPTFNHTADPRPNILPDELYNHHEPYRLRFNRPRYYVGKSLYYVISPTSQEALVWKENLDAGRYDGHDCPPVYKGYYYPKNWEILNTGPRPNFVTASAIKPAPVVPAPTTAAPANASSKEAEKVEAVDAEKAKAAEEALEKAKAKTTEKVPAPN